MDVFEMRFSKVFPLLITKARRKGRTEDEVFAVTEWLTGYSKEELVSLSWIAIPLTVPSWTERLG